MKKKMVLMLGVMMTCACVLGGCGETESSAAGKESGTEMGIETGTETGTEGNGENSEMPESASELGLASGEIDFYNEVKDSNYMTFVLRNSNDTQEAIVEVVDFEGNLGDVVERGFQTICTDTENVYHYGLGTEEKVIYLGNLANGPAWYWLADVNRVETVSMYEKPVHFLEETGYVGAIEQGTNIESSDSKIYAADGSFYVFTKGIGSIPYVFLRVEENDSEYVYASQCLNEMPQEDNLEQSVAALIEENAYNNSLMMVGDLEDLGSVSKVYGEEIKLEDTVFWQDALAAIVSEQFGLNIKDKETLTFVDKSFLKYADFALDNKLMVTVYLDYPLAEEDYSYVKEQFSQESHSYEDKNGVKYEYFSDEENGEIYIFKDESYQGKARLDLEVGNSITLEDSYLDCLGVIFGTKE